LIARAKKPASIGQVDYQRKGGYYCQLGYKAYRDITRDGRSPTEASGSAHLRVQRSKLIAQSREFLRENLIYKGMIERACSYIVGENGFDLQPNTGDNDTDKAIEKEWSKYWRRPELRGLISGKLLLGMACRELLVAGDTAIIPLNENKLQIIEAEQISATGNEDGIEVNQYGVPQKFFVRGWTKNGSLATKPTVYSPSEILFLCNPERPSSLRACPPCQSAFSMLHRINDICDSEALAWQAMSRMALSILRQRGPEQAVTDSIEDDAAAADAIVDRVTEMDYALIFHGEVGDEIKGIERNIPGANFPDTLTMFLRLIGLPLGLPLEVILLDWTKSNYSQSRAVLEQAFKTFTDWQSILEDAFLRQVYIRQMGIWNANGLFRGVDPEAHSWIKPSFPWIDQLKEAQAYGARLDRGLCTHDETVKSLGQDPRELLTKREAEIREAIAIAQGIQADTGQAVPWEIFAGLEVKQAAAPQAKQPTDTQEGKNDQPSQ
jgi:capsid protein